MQTQRYITAGKQDAAKALICIHGRGGTAEDILSLTAHLPVSDYALYAPVAANNSWYPHSFLAAPEDNEPALSNALLLIGELVADIERQGIPANQIFFLGFSQGACLTLEYCCRNARRYGGVIAFTGGLIGDKIYRDRYPGNLNGTPVFIGSSDPDMHVPPKRVHESAELIRELSGDILVKIYTQMGHTIIQEELELATAHVLRPA